MSKHTRTGDALRNKVLDGHACVGCGEEFGPGDLAVPASVGRCERPACAPCMGHQLFMHAEAGTARPRTGGGAPAARAAIPGRAS